MQVPVRIGPVRPADLAGLSVAHPLGQQRAAAQGQRAVFTGYGDFLVETRKGGGRREPGGQPGPMVFN